METKYEIGFRKPVHLGYLDSTMQSQGLILIGSDHNQLKYKHEDWSSKTQTQFALFPNNHYVRALSCMPFHQAGELEANPLYPRKGVSGVSTTRLNDVAKALIHDFGAFVHHKGQRITLQDLSVTPEEHLAEYLELEQLLRQFFDEVDYCYDNCISEPNSLYGQDHHPGNWGCCIGDHANILDGSQEILVLLTQQREELFGDFEPHDNTDRCEWHTLDQGCRLTTHKSPTCISYVCNYVKSHLEYTHGIRYIWQDVADTLESVLDGAPKPERVKILREQLHEKIAQMRKEKTSLDTAAS